MATPILVTGAAGRGGGPVPAADALEQACILGLEVRPTGHSVLLAGQPRHSAVLTVARAANPARLPLPARPLAWW
jgi:hypothetical protein